MRPITLRFKEDFIETLDTEAEQAGFSSRSEYIRYLLANRDTHVALDTSQDTTPTELSDEAMDHLTSLTNRVEVLETQVANIEAELESESHSQRKRGASEKTADTNTTETAAEDADEADREEALAGLARWLEANGPDSEAAQAILVDAARLLADRGELRAGELRDLLYDEHPDAYGSAKTLWSATVSRWHDDIPGFEKPERGIYRFDRSELTDSH